MKQEQHNSTGGTLTGDALLETVKDKELVEALRKRRTETRGRPRKNAPKGEPREEFVRFCALVSKEHIRHIREASLVETKTIKELLFDIFEEYFNRYEQENRETLEDFRKRNY